MRKRKGKEWIRKVALFAVTALLAGSIDMTAYATDLDIDEVVTFTATEETEWKFDFGQSGSAVQDGWTQVTTKSVYDEAVGYGWKGSSVPNSDWTEKTEDSTLSADIADVARDYVRGSGEWDFAVDVSNGDYEVTVYASYTNTSKDVYYQIENAEAITQTGVKSFTEWTRTVTVEDNQLNIKNGNSGKTTEIRGLLIKKIQEVEKIAAPANFTLNQGETTEAGVEVTFSFDEVTGTKAYKLYQIIGTAEATVLEELTTNSYETTVEKGAKYTYYVTAVDENDVESDASESVVLDLTGGEAQTDFYFDFGKSDSEVQEGWTKVTRESQYTYSDDLGFGWVTVPGGEKADEWAEDNLDIVLSDEYKDLVAVADDRIRGSNVWEFAVNVPNGHYNVTIYGGYPSETNRYDLTYESEGHAMAMSVYDFSSVTKEVTVEDGVLNVKNGVDGRAMEIRGLAIEQTLATPTSLEATADTTKLNETDVAAPVTFSFKGIEEAAKYMLYQSSSVGDGKMKLLSTFEAGEDWTQETHTEEVLRGATYKYYIIAVTAEGKETVESNTAELDLVSTGGNAPAIPQKLEVTNSETANMQLAWDAVDGALVYNVYRSQQGDTPTLDIDEDGDIDEVDVVLSYKLVGTTDGTTYTDTNADVTNNISWYYKVQAQNVYGVSELSDTAVTEIGDSLTAETGTWNDRALVAINLAGDAGAEVSVSATDKDGNEYNSGVYLSWRSYEEDFAEDGKTLTTTFDLYKNGELLEGGLKVTNLIDEGGTADDTYKVVGSNDKAGIAAFGEDGLEAKEVPVWENQYLEFQLVKPDKQTVPDGTVSDYVPNDTMLADLDGDGDLDLVVKWRPRNFKDNGFNGYSATTFYDGYDVDFSTGEIKMLWRIDMGVNIRSGSHYEVVQVWDYNNDGKAEVALKTSDGTSVYKPIYEGDEVTGFEQLEKVGCCWSEDLPVDLPVADHTHDDHDYRETDDNYGHVVTAPEYFTMFNGEDGTIIDTVDYKPELGDLASWGDTSGNRGFRFLAATAYLDGVNPYYIQCRGYYERTALAAYRLVPDNDGDGKEDLELVWLFDTENYDGKYEGQGNHGLAIADVDNDGKDEIVYGGLLLDHDGTPVYSTELDHGDAMHVTDLVLWNPGQEVMSVHEHTEVYYAAEVRDAASGEILMGMHIPGGIDLGRGVADDIDPSAPGGEWWTVINPDYDATDGEPSVASKQGSVLSTESRGEDLVVLSNYASPASNALIYWDGDLLREIQDKEWNFSAKPDGAPVSVQIGKWNYIDNKEEYIFDSTEVWAHGTKGNLGIVADFLGDWREEFITMTSFGDFSTNENGTDSIRVYTTTIQTDYVIPCLMEDLQYQEALAWQNTGYNQPAHLSYMLSEGTITAQLTQKELLYNKVTFDFTEANDGNVWGHEVTGYEIWRADVDDDGNVGSYEKIATVDSDARTYTDTDVEQAQGYSYTVAAIVDNKTSYRSQPLKVTIPRNIQEVLPIELQPLVEGNAPLAALPSSVTILSTDGVQEQATVTWDIDGFEGNVELDGSVGAQTIAAFNNTTIGEQQIVAHVNGWETPIVVTWKVIEKEIRSFNDIETIKVIKGNQPVLPTQVDALYNDGEETQVDVTWNTTELDVNTVGTYEIKGTIAEPVEVEGLVPTVLVRVAEDYVVSASNSYVEIEIGKDLSMPTAVAVEYKSGKTDTIDVEWAVEGVSTDEIADYEIKGIVDGDFEVTAYVKVVYPAVMRFDFGVDASNTVDGWIEILGGTKTTKTVEELGINYTAEKGYGFTNLTLKGDGRTGQNYTQEGFLPKEIYQDMALVGGQTFVVDLPNGTYVVEIISGSTDANTINAFVEDVQLKVSSAKSAYEIGSLEVEVKDKQLTIEISGNTVRMNGIIIRQVEVAEEPPAPTTTPVPTATPVPTTSPVPAETPVPTSNPAPTATPTPVTQEVQKGVTYKVSGSGVTVTKIDKTTTSATIPATVTIGGKTYKVTSIAKNAAKGNTKLTKVMIGKNVTSVGDNAFSGCTKLKTVTIGANVKTIGIKAFYNCKALTRITIPKKVITIGKSAFENCTKLKTLKFASGSALTTIKDKAFSKCNALTKVTIPAKVTTIGKSAFANCTKLSTLTIGKKVVTISASAFSKCTALKKVTIPASVKTIGASAFANCKNLKSITIKTTKLTTKSVGNKAFSGINAKATIKVPKAKLATYKSLLVKKGVKKTATIKK